MIPTDRKHYYTLDDLPKSVRGNPCVPAELLAQMDADPELRREILAVMFPPERIEAGRQALFQAQVKLYLAEREAVA